MTCKKDYITNIQKFSIHDGPGIRTNVFFKGCRLKCKWCANPEGIVACRELMYYKQKCNNCGNCISVCPHQALRKTTEGIQICKTRCKKCNACITVCSQKALKISGTIMSIDEVFQQIQKDEVFYEMSGGGVTFSGGEPFLHPQMIGEIAAKCREKGYNIAAETCGLFEILDVLPIIHLFDLLLFDLKIMDDKKHQYYCGESNQVIHQNFKTLVTKVPIIPRIPIIPTINDSPEDIQQLCTFLALFKEHLKTVHILPYHTLGLSKYEALQKPYELEDLFTPTNEHMAEIKQTIELHTGLSVSIGG